MRSTRYGNPKSIVVMPALRRPEMAALSLERIRQTPESNELDVRIFVDFTTDEVLGEFEYVRDLYFPEAQIHHARSHIAVPSGSWNILQSLKAGYDSGCEVVFLIEEDVMVFPDYFQWSFEAHDRNPDCFACSGRLRKEHSSNYYTNPGASFKRDKLGLVIPHINDSYFADQRSYLDERFGEFPEASPLDDGLIRRVIRKAGGNVVYPETPKVAHQGFHYYNRLPQFKVQGTIQERVESCRKLLSNLSDSGRYNRDFEPCHPQQ